MCTYFGGHRPGVVLWQLRQPGAQRSSLGAKRTVLMTAHEAGKSQKQITAPAEAGKPWEAMGSLHVVRPFWIVPHLSATLGL